MSRIPAARRREVHERAGGHCEYCGLPDGMDIVPHEVDHIVAVKHGGTTEADNLALACYLCNKHKGTDLTSVDPESGVVSLLYNPRRNVWEDHFRVAEHRIIGRTAEGRTTIRLLQLNREDRVSERVALTRAGLLSLPVQLASAGPPVSGRSVPPSESGSKGRSQ